MPEVTISLEGHAEELAVFGSRDQYLRQVRDAVGVKVLARTARSGSREIPPGSSRRGGSSRDYARFFARGRRLPRNEVSDLINVTLGGCAVGRVGRARDTRGQPGRSSPFRRASALHEALLENELVFCIGPAGTGRRTWLWRWRFRCCGVVASRKIVLVRPAVEAGEHPGFLPGTWRPRSTRTCGLCWTLFTI